MGKYKRYKNRLEMFLSSDKGKRVLNFLYSWGASIVILGALFKLLHIAYANQILFIAMITESLVFFISAFEKPSSEYHWEDVFPVLKSKNPLDRPDFAGGTGSGVGFVGNGETDENGVPLNVTMTSSPGGGFVASGGHGQAGGMFVGESGGGNEGGGMAHIDGGASISGGGKLNIAGSLDVSEEDTKNLAESIKKLSGAAEQISKMAELTEATQKYLDQMSVVSGNMERFSEVTNSLTDVSDTLLCSYKSITDNSEGIQQNSRGYVQQMEALNRNVSGLNTIYEIQLKSISSQIESIERINAGLGRIREMYDGSVVDSSVFRTETEKMTRQLSELNHVYTRLLQAMTVNMPGNTYPQPPVQQDPYQQYPPQQGYGQQNNPYHQQQPPYPNK